MGFLKAVGVGLAAGFYFVGMMYIYTVIPVMAGLALFFKPPSWDTVWVLVIFALKASVWMGLFLSLGFIGDESPAKPICSPSRR